MDPRIDFGEDRTPLPQVGYAPQPAIEGTSYFWTSNDSADQSRRGAPHLPPAQLAQRAVGCIGQLDVFSDCLEKMREPKCLFETERLVCAYASLVVDLGVACQFG